ncbi:AAA family ATPase, partial [Spirosoma sp. RP8]
MITKIEVDGFKSLREFELHLHKGLNILVGPNGSGKTNIILFFEFLSNIVNNQVGNAISYVGGAGSIFHKTDRDKYLDKITCKIYGSFQTKLKTYVVYEYSFEINISFEKDNVFYSRQELKIRDSSEFLDNPDKITEPIKWDLDIEVFPKDIDKCN